MAAENEERRGIRILVCIRIVPQMVSADSPASMLCAQEAQFKLNPYDAYALEMALRLKDGNPENEITVLTYGGAHSKSILRECLALGADRVIWIKSDDEEKHDAIQTAEILARQLRMSEEEEGSWPLILCGVRSERCGTALTGPALAEMMRRRLVSNVEQIYDSEGQLTVIRHTGGCRIRQKISERAVCTVGKVNIRLRYPDIGKLISMKNHSITPIELETPPRSRFRVINIVSNEKKRRHLLISDENPSAKSKKLFFMLREDGWLQ